MRASVLFVCVLVAAALACPLKKHEDKKCSCLPKIVPFTWQVQSFPDQYSTLLFQGQWFLTMATPTCINGQIPLKCGLFYNVFPSMCNRAIFHDDTPLKKFDFNINYIMLDSSFNLITQTMDYSQSVLRPAYPKSNLALFNIATQQTYKTPIQSLNQIIDEDLVKCQVDKDYYPREYAVAVIGCDIDWQQYMIFVLLNEYENLFSGKDEHIMWVFTRKRIVDSQTYKQIFDDIKRSGLNPCRLMSVDQSIDLTTVPGLTKDDITGVVQKITKKTEESSSSSNGGVVMSSKKTTVEETTTSVSTVEYNINPTFSIPYGYEAFEWSNGIKVLKDLTLEQYANALSGKLILSLATPLRTDDNGRPGLLNTAFPCSSPQVIVQPIDGGSWKFEEQYMMIERCYNAITGELVITRNLLQIACTDGSMPFASVLIYSEGYTEKSIVEVNPFSYDKVTVKTTNLLYKQKLIMGITAFQPNKYVMLCMYNQIPNQMYQKNPVSPFYVFTRDTNLSKSDTETITQEILRSGYLPQNLIKMDQNKPIDDTYKFEKLFFFPDSPSMPNSQLGQPKFSPGLGPIVPPNYPTDKPKFNPGLGPMVPRPYPSCTSPKSVPTDYCPSSLPSSWKVKLFENQEATIAMQGTWYLQFGSVSKMNGLCPMKTGLFADTFPTTKIRTIFMDTTPCEQFDFNTDYYWLDTSFNAITQKIETVQGLLRAAYPSTHLAIFNVCVPPYYSKPIPDITSNDDINEVRYKLDEIYQRQFTVAIIGADWSEYLVFAVMNQYDNVYNGPNDYLIWVFSRSENCDSEVYRKACNDIKASGMSPYGLMSMDQSIDLTQIPTVSEDDINGVIQSLTVKTTEEKKETCTSTDGISSSSTTSSTTKTTYESSSIPSPFNIVVRPNFVSPYQLDVSKYSGNIKTIQNLPLKDVRKAISGHYYVSMARPLMCEENGKPGFLNNMFPSASLFVQFEEFDELDWTSSKQYMMLDGGIDVLTGQVHKTRTIIQTAFDETWRFSTFIFFSEGYYKSTIPEIQPFVYDGIICKSPPQIYRDKYMVSIAAYKEDLFVALLVHNQFRNLANKNDKKNQMVVLTRRRTLTKDEIDEITQLIALTGYTVSDLMFIDQTKVIDEQITLESSYFQIITESSSSCASSSVSSSQCSSTVIEESASSSSKVEIISN